MDVLKWMEALPVSDWITSSDWGFPIMLVFHSLGLAAVVGILVMLDLRVLGFASSFPLEAFHKLMRVAWLGFFVNLASGTLLFMADASRLIVNWPFWTKMSCILLGGIVSALLWGRLRSAGGNRVTAEERPAALLTVDRVARVWAIASIVLWFGAITFGRLIAYIMDRALLHGDLK
jgi:hypothetical protein